MPKIITIIGQKGAGKTTLFRKIVKKHLIANSKNISPIVNYSEESIKIENKIYRLIDTPAFIFSPKNEIEQGIKNQTEELVKKSDLILWVVDEIDEATFLLNQYLKKSKIPQILLLSKIDLENGEEKKYSCQVLRPEIFLPISALRETNWEKLTTKITELVPASSAEVNEKEAKLSLLIFGPPNSGKSTLMNYLLKENRSLATPVAGTTQEPVISHWNWKKIDFQLVDTAGITKEQKIKENLWRKCDLAWAIIDATLPLTKQILQIINLGEKHTKPLIIIINKCDLIVDKKILETALRSRLKSLKYSPIIYLSALKGIGVNSLMKILEKILEQAQQKISKKALAELTEKMLLKNPPKYYRGNKLKIYFAKHEPGLVHYFILFVNNPQWAHFSYQRYIVNYLRKSLGLEYLPIKIVLKKSE